MCLQVVCKGVFDVCCGGNGGFVAGEWIWVVGLGMG
jgi:hypothetical protein